MGRTARIEIRSEPEREERIRQAAGLVHQSVSSFMLDAASDRAEQVIVAARTTVVPDAFFSQLLAGLDEPVQANKALTERAARPRQVTQH